MRKKLLSMFLVLCMVFTMLPVSAMAEEVHTTNDANGESIEFADLEETVKTVPIGTSFEDLVQPETLTAPVGATVMVEEETASTVTGSAISYGIWVGGVEVTSANKGSVTGSSIIGTVTYDPDSATLTLDDAEITGAHTDNDNMYGIYATGDLNLVLENEISTVESLNNNDGDSAGIYTLGNLTISGSGSLIAKGGQVTAGVHSGSSGIHLENGNLTVNSGIVWATGGDASNASHGVLLCGADAILTVKGGGNLLAVSGASTYSYGILSENTDAQLIVDGGSLSAHGGIATNESYGIATAGSILVKGNAILEATGDTATSRSYGIYSNSFTIDGGAVTAIGDTATNMSYGIYNNSFTINGGTVEVASTEAGISQAISDAPIFGSGCVHQNTAGANVIDATVVTDEELTSGISGYKYVKIVSYDVWVGDVRVTSENKDNITCECIEGVVTYDPDSATLTLNGASITDTAYIDAGNKYGIYANGDLNLVRIGSSSIVIPSPAEEKDGAGIYVSGNLTIYGDGSLTVTGGQVTSGAHGSSYGIHVEDGDLTVEGGNLTATGAAAGSASGASYGICVHDGNLTIKDEGSVIASADDAGMVSSGVILGGSNVSLTVERGSSLRATGGDPEIGASTAKYSFGIQADESQLIVDGSVTANGCFAVRESCGIRVSEVIVNSNATLEAIGGSAADVSYGISSSHITINGGTVEVASTEAGISQAISDAPIFGSGCVHQNTAGANVIDATVVTDEELTSGISGYKYVKIVSYDVWVGDVRVTSENKDNITCECIEGVVTYDPDSATLTLNGASITDTAYIDAGNKYGIYANGDLNLVRIGSSSIVIPSPAEEKDGAGIYVSGNLTIYGDGSLTVTGGQVTSGAHGSSYGIHVEDGDLTVEGGNLTATGAAAGSASGASYGICVHDGNLTIKDEGRVFAKADDAGMMSCGVSLGGCDEALTVESGSSLIAIGGDPETETGTTTADLSYGIHSEELSSTQLIVNGGSVTAIGYSAGVESCGILVGKVIVNSNATLEAIGGSAADVSYGICSNHITINGGTVEVASTEAERSQAMSSAPTFGSGYVYTINAGTNGQDATYVTGAELSRGISGYKYIEITSRIQNGGGSGDGSGSGSGGGSYTPTPAPTIKPTAPATGIVESKATVDSNGNASIHITEKNITDAIASAKAEAEKNGVNIGDARVIIHVSTEGTNASDFTVNLPKSVQQQIMDNGIAGIELVIEPDITLGIDQLAMKEINKQAKADVQITITRTDSSKLSTAAKDAIGGRPVYDFEVSYKDGSKNVSNFGKGMVYVRIPYTPADDEVVGYLHIVYVDGKGKTSRVMESTYDANSESLIFASNHFSLYGVGYTTPSAKFTDINTHWAKDSIDYVVGRGLLSGTTKTTFSPNLALTRELLVTALGKLAGVDTKAYTTKTFKDVKAKSPSRPYIEWAYSKGIIKGISSSQFEPNRGITREEIAFIMANYAKAMNYKLPATRSAIEFADASSIGSSYEDAVKSMQQAGIIMGEASNKFNPKAIVTRAEISAMIHRLIKLTIDPTAAQGWAQNDDGQYMYYTGGRIITGWQTINSAKYFLNTDGTLKTGWVQDDTGNKRYYSGNQMIVGFWDIGAKGNSKTYYFDTNGNMVSGKWLQIDGKWYYLNADGVLARSTKINEFEVDENGVRITK